MLVVWLGGGPLWLGVSYVIHDVCSMACVRHVDRLTFFFVRCVLGSSVSIDMCSGHVVGFGSCVWGFLWCACGTMLLEVARRLWCICFAMLWQARVPRYGEQHVVGGVRLRLCVVE